MARTFGEYAAANGVPLLAPPSPSPRVLVGTTNIPPDEAQERLRRELATRLATAAAAPSAPPTTGPVSLAAAPAMPTTITTGVPTGPLARFGAEVATLAGGVTDPTASLPERGLRGTATLAQIPLMAADIPRQVAVAGSGEAFAEDATRYGPWSIIMASMGGLGATQTGGLLTAITNPAGIRGRTDLEKQIVPDEFTGPMGSTEDRMAAYAAYMASQPPEVQQATLDAFNQWITQKRQEYYTPNGDLKQYINFEEWQALNVDKALVYYQNGWQKPAAPIQHPDGSVTQPEVNENPVFVGGQAVWEAYVNELDPAQRIFADISRDPLTPLSFAGGPLEAGAARLGARVGGRTGRVLAGTGRVANEALNFPSPGPAVRAGRFLGQRAAATRPGMALAASPAGRGFERVRSLFRQDPRLLGNEGAEGAYRLASERLALGERGIAPQETAPGTTVPPGFRPDPATAARAVAEAQVTTFDEVERAAATKAQGRYTPPPPTAPIGEVDRTKKVKYFEYSRDPVAQTANAVRVVRNEVEDRGVRYVTYDVEDWDTTTGEFTTAQSVRVGGGVTVDQARRQAENIAIRITRQHEATRRAAGLPDVPLQEVGMSPTTPPDFPAEFFGDEIIDMHSKSLDPRVIEAVQRGNIDGEALSTLRDKLTTILTDDTVWTGAPVDQVSATIPMTEIEFDALRQTLETVGDRPFQTVIEPPTAPIEQATLPTPPPAPTIEPPQPGLSVGTRPVAAPEAPRSVGVAGDQAGVSALPDVEDLLTSLPEPTVAPEITPVTVRLGGEGGVGAGITPATYTHLLGVARRQDPELATALERFADRPGRGRAAAIGELTLDQARRLRSLETTITPSKSNQADPIRRGLARLYDDLDIAIRGQEITPPPAVGPTVVPPPTPPVRRTVAVPTNVRDRVLASDLPETLKSRFQGETRNRGRGQVIDVVLGEDELDLLDSLTGHNVKRDVRRVRTDFPNAPEVSPETPTAAPGATEARPTIPSTPTTTPLAETAARLMEERGLPVREAAAPTPPAPEVPPPRRQAALEDATPTPTQELRDKMLRAQYPGRPIAYDLGDGRFQLLDIDVPSGVSTTAKFSTRKTTPSFTGTREEILANAPDAVFINPREGFRATGADNVVIPPAGRVTDYAVGIWDAVPKNRVSQAPAPTPEGIKEITTPFRSALLRTADTLPNNATIKGLIEDDLDKAEAEYLSVTRSGYGAAEGDGPAHEVETALTLADRVLTTMEDAFEGIVGWQTGFDEFRYGEGRPIQNDPHLDFDAVLRAVFGSSRQARLGTEGFETAAMRETGGRTAKVTGSGAVQKELQRRIEMERVRGNDAAVTQLTGLMTEIDTLRQRYIDLIGRRTGADYYSTVPGGPQAAGLLTRAARGVGELVGGEAQRPVEAVLNPTPDAELIDLLTVDAQAAARVQWVDHPEFGGLDSFTVLNEIGNQVRVDKTEYADLVAKGVTVPEPKVQRGRKPVYGKLTPDQERMRDLAEKYRYVMPLGQTLDTVPEELLTTNRFIQEFLREKGMIRETDTPTSWLGRVGRWMAGMHRDLGSASGQMALHDPTNFRYMAMNYFGNPFLVAARFPRAALRTAFRSGFKTAYAEATEGTFSPVARILKAEDVATGAEIFAARLGITVPREVMIDEKFAHERASVGVRNLMKRLGIEKQTNILSDWFERGARKHITIESHQRAAAWWARAEERVAEAWQDTKPAIVADLTAAGLSEDAVRTMERGLPKAFGAFELHDAVFRTAQREGMDETASRALARRAYDQWRTPSVRAAYTQAVSDIAGPMPLNRKTPIDEKLGLLAPFTFWNTRITNYLMQEIYGSPVRMAAFERYQDWAEDYKRNHPEMPSYLGGYINAVMTPFGVFLAANPVALILTNAFLEERSNMDGVDKTMWDEIRDSVGEAIGWSPMPHLQFLAQALGYSRDRGINLPIILPPSVKTFGAFIDWLSAETEGLGGKPIVQDFFTWLSRDAINPLASKFLPGAELSSLRDPELARQSPVHAMIVQQHPELLSNMEAADAMPPGPEREAALQAASEAIVDAFENEQGDIYRQAWETVAAGKLLTQTINQASPVRVTGVNPVVPSIQAGIQENVTLAEQREPEIAAVEAEAAGLPGTVPLGTNATSPGTNPIGTGDWRSDPRWANHLTGGPAPDVQASTADDYLYFANDLIGGTPEFRRLATVDQRYHSIGTPEERQAYQDHYAIAYGTPMRTVDMGGGRIYNPADILALPDEERKMLADEWIMTHATFAGQPLVPLIESYRMQRDQFRAANPEWAAYDTWRDTVQEMVDLGQYPSVLEWGRIQAVENPNFKRVYDDVLFRLESGEYDQERAESRLKSIGAYMASQGLQKNVTDPAVVAATAAGGGGLSREETVALIQQMTNTGAAFNPAEAIRQDMQAYSRDLAVTDTFLRGIGFTGSWEYASDNMKQWAAPMFEQYGIPMPSLSRDTQAYLAWAQTHPNGTPEEFLAERQRAQLAVMTGGLPLATTPVP